MQRQRVLISVSAFACGVHVAVVVVVVVVSTAVAVIVNISILSQHKFVYHIVYYIVCTALGLQRVLQEEQAEERKSNKYAHANHGKWRWPGTVWEKGN